MSNYWGTVTLITGTRATALVAASGLSGVLIGNESGLTVIVTMQGANTSRSLYPGTVDWFPLPTRSQFNGNLFFDPTANLSNASSWPSSYVQIDTFGMGEAPTGTYPMALPRNTNVGNSLTTNVTNTTLVNDGSVTGTTIVEATPQGDLASAVVLKNDGTLTLGNATHKGSISSGNGAFTSDVSGNTSVGGTLGVTGAATFQNTVDFFGTGVTSHGGIIQTFNGNNISSAGDLLGASGKLILNGADVVDISGTDLSIIANTGHNGLLSISGGGGVIAEWNTSFFTINKPLKLMNGNTLARVGGISGTGSGTFNHDLGSTPDFVAITTHAVGSQTVGYDSETSTQIHVTTGAGLAWFGFLTKRT